MNASITRSTLLILVFLVLAACASPTGKPSCVHGEACSVTTERPEAGWPTQMLDDETIAAHQHWRRFRESDELGYDPVERYLNAAIDPKPARMRIIGSSYEESVRSLAAKIWLIDHAEYSVDAVYYIFKRDLAGFAVLGALCEAVQRGVDVRIMVDSVGSTHATHGELKALLHCAEQAGMVNNADGEASTTQARVQAVLFNAMSRVFVNHNRRAHDKLLVVDGVVPERAWVMTGGRNVSLSYYGLNADGSADPTAYKDMEILLRPGEGVSQAHSVGRLSEEYYSLLFSHTRNKRLDATLSYNAEQQQMTTSLAQLRAIPDFAHAYQQMPTYLGQLRSGQVRLAHELQNLNSDDVVDDYDQNLAANPNSIVWILQRLSDHEHTQGLVRIVSPYFFVPRYVRKDGEVYFDGRDELYRWLAEHPDNRLEIVTNSVLTSDNFFAQAVIDMDTAPSLLLDGETTERWRENDLAKSEANPGLVEGEQWLHLVDNPRVRIYQTGRLDSVLLGGDRHYGKLHAKFVLAPGNLGFVGTHNFDYRSRLFNNEMGFFFDSKPLMQDLVVEFERLKAQSYVWGSPEWLALREQVRQAGGDKGGWTERQRSTYRTIYGTNLHWQF